MENRVDISDVSSLDSNVLSEYENDLEQEANMEQEEQILEFEGELYSPQLKKKGTKLFGNNGKSAADFFQLSSKMQNRARTGRRQGYGALVPKSENNNFDTLQSEDLSTHEEWREDWLASVAKDLKFQKLYLGNIKFIPQQIYQNFF